MDRVYEKVVLDHLNQLRQMVFLMGPRQIGKTTLALQASSHFEKSFYFNWDDPSEKLLFIEGPDAIAKQAALHTLHKHLPAIIFDEIHKYNHWKNFLKGFFDKYEKKAKVIVTGSARLNVYQKGGDSLMGRYLYYRIHPLSVREVLNLPFNGQEIHPPHPIEQSEWEALLEFGGFPEPFVQRSKTFSKRLYALKQEQLFYEDIRDTTRIQEIAQMQLLGQLLENQSAQSLDFTSLSKKIRVSVDTIRRWIEVLKSFYFCFTIQPWSKNIPRSLIKEPKLYLWDWSCIPEKGQRYENIVANHLLKAVHFWEDLGLGSYGLHYLRNKQKQEVDFLVSKEGKPWFLVEVKSKANTISKSLYEFQQATQAPYAFQVCFDLPYIDQDCFTSNTPTIVPAKTFLSQLI